MKISLVSDLLKINVIESHILGATSFSSLAVYIPSGPGLFDAFRLLKMETLLQKQDGNDVT